MNKTYNSSTAFADWDDNNWQEHSEGDNVHFLIIDGNILEFMIENGVYYEVCIFDDTGLKDSNKPGIKTNIYISRRTADNTLEQRNWIRWFTN